MNYEIDSELPDVARIDGWHAGIAWHILGWETEPDEDTEWSGYEVRTGLLSVVMVGDDRVFTAERSEVHSIDREEYCGECGQIGCEHDGLDRS